MEYNFRKDIIRRQMSESRKDTEFWLSVLGILTFKIFYLQNVGGGHRVQFCSKRHSLAKVKIYKRLPHFVALALSFREINIIKC